MSRTQTLPHFNTCSARPSSLEPSPPRVLQQGQVKKRWARPKVHRAMLTNPESYVSAEQLSPVGPQESSSGAIVAARTPACLPNPSATSQILTGGSASGEAPRRSGAPAAIRGVRDARVPLRRSVHSPPGCVIRCQATGLSRRRLSFPGFQYPRAVQDPRRWAQVNGRGKAGAHPALGFGITPPCSLPPRTVRG